VTIYQGFPFRGKLCCWTRSEQSKITMAKWNEAE